MKRIAFFLLLCSFLPAGIAPVEIDWTHFVLRVTTLEQSSVNEIVRKALFTIQYDNTRIVADYLASRIELENKIIDCIRDHIIVRQNFMTDGGTEFVHELQLTNTIMSLLLPVSRPVQLVVPMLCPCCGQEWPKYKPVPNNVTLCPQQVETSEYTGLVIDCRGHTLNPCLFPRVTTEEGAEVYSVNFTHQHRVVEWGLVQYTIDDELILPRVGSNPLFIKAKGTSGIRNTDITISTHDAHQIHGSKETVQLLKECRVVIIFGP